ncbi:MAG: hypothetical protein ABI888_02960 [Chloroflexota bacterium]
MARAMRPVVLLMLLATVLFVVDGLVDHSAVPSGVSILDEYKGLGWTSFVFAFANLLLTIAVARGSERTLLGRIALSGFFIVERPVTAFVLGDKPLLSIAVHMATAVVELVILIGAVRVWRLGHSLVAADIDAMFSVDSPGVSLPPAPQVESPVAKEPRSSGWLIGLLTLMLALILVADGVVADFVPGGRDWGTVGDSSGWLVYLFAVVILTVATRAVHGGSVALRLLMILALIFFIERSFSPFALKVIDPIQLGLHGLAALISLALAIATAAAIRSGAGTAARRRASPAS